MSFFSRFISGFSGSFSPKETSFDASRYAFFDVEVSLRDKQIHDIGALRWDGAVFHSAQRADLFEFIKEVDFLCGHNVVHHDAKYLFGGEQLQWMLVPWAFL